MKLKFLSVLFVSSIFLSACSNPFDQLADEINNFISSDSSKEDKENIEENNGSEDTTADNSIAEDADTTVEQQEEEIETVDYSHLLNKGEEVILDEGTHDVGSDITPGRYTITTDVGYGSISIKDAEDYGILNETIVGATVGATESADDQPSQINVLLDEDYRVEISNIESVTLTPYETASVSKIFPGQWIVGEDFPAGVYDISLEKSDMYGSLEVYSQRDMVKSRHSLGSANYGGMTEFTMSFTDGDIVELRYLPEVTLTER